jgi:hypothetical protein
MVEPSQDQNIKGNTAGLRALAPLGNADAPTVPWDNRACNDAHGVPIAASGE